MLFPLGYLFSSLAVFKKQPNYNDHRKNIFTLIDQAQHMVR